MKRVICLLSIFVALLCGCGNMINSVNAANPRIELFHNQFNEQKWHLIFSSADPSFFKSTPQEDCIRFLTVVHRKLGNVIRSQNSDWNVNTNTSGTTITMTQDTQFEKGKAIETFVFTIRDQKAYLLDYNINSRELIMN